MMWRSMVTIPQSVLTDSARGVSISGALLLYRAS